MSVGPQGVAGYPNHVLPPSGHRHVLCYAIGFKQDAVFHFQRLVLRSLVEVTLDKHEDAVATTHFNVMKLGAFLSVDI